MRHKTIDILQYEQQLIDIYISDPELQRYADENELTIKVDEIAPDAPSVLLDDEPLTKTQYQMAYEAMLKRWRERTLNDIDAAIRESKDA